MAFLSILFAGNGDGITRENAEAPDYFVDLNLDQIIDAITAGRDEYELKPFFYTPVNDLDMIVYRQEVMQDLENKALFEGMTAFAQKMSLMRNYLAQAEKLFYTYQKESWFVDAIGLYCEAVNGLAQNLAVSDIKSRGLLAFREYITEYVASSRFKSLVDGMTKVKVDLSGVRYCLLIRGNNVRVRKYDSEIDYGAEVLETFEKFKQGVVKDYRVKFHEWPEMNHVEAQILDLVAQLYPDVFHNLDSFCKENSDYLDPTVGTFDREIQFYLAYLEYLETFKRKGLKFCYPNVTKTSKEVFDYEGFDLALAYKLNSEGSPIVCNDFYLKGKERIIVVTGPNQGGKTTFARTFGQLHYLASLGCPVPGREAQLFLFDRMFTHFEKEESINNLRGKLEDEMIRIHEILDQATPDSIILINEIFTSTTLKDAIFLSEKIMERIIQLDLLCVWVTFIDELASLDEKVVSMASTVTPENPTVRTFKIVRKPADGLAYALSIAEKYRLTYELIKERLVA